MDKIRKLLSLEQSKEIRDEIIAYVYKNPKSINDLMDCFFDDNQRLNQYASWPVSIIGEKRPDILKPYIPKMIKALDKPSHSAIVRSTFRVLQTTEIPKELEGIVYDIAFMYLSDVKTPASIRAFCMTVLTNIALIYPDLKEELKKTIEIHYPYGSPGYKSRAKKEMKRLR